MESLPLKLQSIFSWLVNIMVPTKIAGFFFLACRLSPFVSASIHFFFCRSFIMFHPWVFSSSNHQMLKKILFPHSPTISPRYWCPPTEASALSKILNPASVPLLFRVELNRTHSQPCLSKMPRHAGICREISMVKWT